MVLVESLTPMHVDVQSNESQWCEVLHSSPRKQIQTFFRSLQVLSPTPIFFQMKFCLAKKLFTTCNKSATFVVSESGSQNKNSYLIASTCVYRTYTWSWAHWETSVTSFSCILHGNVAFSASFACFRMVSRDKATAPNATNQLSHFQGVRFYQCLSNHTCRVPPQFWIQISRLFQYVFLHQACGATFFHTNSSKFFFPIFFLTFPNGLPTSNTDTMTGVPHLSPTMYPFRISTNQCVPLKFFMKKYFIMINYRYIYQ